jgi:hypothetical protein
MRDSVLEVVFVACQLPGDSMAKRILLGTPSYGVN